MSELSKEDKNYCYRMGYDAEVNGASENNCHFSIFSSAEKTQEWEKGKSQAVLDKLYKAKNKVLKKNVGRPRTTVEVNREKLIGLRKGMGLKQSDMAEMTGYSLGRIAQFETGILGGVPLSALKDMSKILVVDWRDLLVRDEE